MRQFQGVGRRRIGFRMTTWIFCGIFGLAMSTARANPSGAAPYPTPPTPPTSPTPPAPAVAPPRPAPQGSGPADPWTSPEGPGNYPQGGYAAAPLGAAPPDGFQPGAPAGYGPPDGGFIRVDVKADGPGVRLDRVVGPGATVPVCFAPCTRVLPRNNLYVIQGDGVRTTSQFLLPDDRPDVTLKVHAGSTARQTGGAALLVGGIVAAYVGLITTEVGLAAQTFNDGTQTSNRSTGTATAGAGILVVGIAAAIGGLVMVLGSSTRVDSSTGATFTNAEPPRKRPRSAVAVTANGLEF
jgi:hypothetical protein